ncbi:MAG: N-acetylmuramoyl-L-alanine amidase [Bacteroidales bacterium]|nr:N-acetylmuramoyl-L-alanine amidase [Bacteroidales bacterium]HOY40148.1 N-acetylmuramoyl-L-alanine amidase [Bacteroidales bacterium]HQP04876.1 N-acetylmuramoyl-L-alanine amidase [Bacteroidales bacterium]
MANIPKHVNIVFAFCLFFIMLALPYAKVSAQSAGSVSVKRVVIDPGHGGKDPGAVGAISKEKDLTLAISLKVGDLIKKSFPDVEVIYTRSTDEFVELHKRAQIANEKKADLFICIHVNAIAGGTAYGAETFVMGLSVTDENMRVAKLENSVILKEDNYQNNYEGFDPNSPESNIMFSLYQNAFIEQSLKLSDKVQKYMKSVAGRYDRGVKQAGFLVLWRTAMPSILIECGFITHKDEEKYMNSEEGQNQIAKAIFDAFSDYKKSLDNEGKEIKGSGSQDSVTEKPENNTAIEKPISDNSFNFAEGIFFGVQVKASAKKIDISKDSFLSGKGLVYEYEQGGLFKYVVAVSRDYESTNAEFVKLRGEVKDCFMVAFRNGERIPVIQAQKELKQ